MLSPGTQIEKYVVLEDLGAGGMARVFKVRHVMLQSLHALKVLDQSLVANEVMRQRFLSEGQIQARLDHPGIARITDVIVQPGIAGLVVEFVDGETLDDHISKMTEPPSADQVRSVFLPLLDALGYAHAEGIVHRDIKPSNIVLARGRNGDLRPKILDFGIAKIIDAALGPEAAKARTRTGAQLGTPNYMSPEQIRGPSRVDGRADLFSLAATMYEFATLTVPYDGGSDFDVMTKIVAGEIVPVRAAHSGIAAPIAACIERGLLPRADDRFASAAAFSAALGSSAHPRAIPPATSKPSRSEVASSAPSQHAVLPLDYAHPSSPDVPASDRVADPSSGRARMGPGRRRRPTSAAPPAKAGRTRSLIALAGVSVLLAIFYFAKPAPVALIEESERQVLPKEALAAALRDPEDDGPGQPGVDAPGQVSTAEPEAAGPNVGRIEFKTSPSVEVFVTVDGKTLALGRTPLSRELPAGRFRFRFVREQRRLNITRTYPVMVGGAHKHNLDFIQGTLKVNAPEGAAIQLNGDGVGVAPMKKLPIYEGKYHLRVTKDSMRWVKWFEAPPGAHIRYDVSFE